MVFTAAPVLDAEGAIVGIATEADPVRDQILPDGWALNPPPDVPVSVLMTPGPFVMGPGADLADLADIVAFMLAHGIRSVPIVDHGRLIGILSRRDVLRCAAR